VGESPRQPDERRERLWQNAGPASDIRSWIARFEPTRTEDLASSATLAPRPESSGIRENFAPRKRRRGSNDARRKTRVFRYGWRGKGARTRDGCGDSRGGDVAEFVRISHPGSPGEDRMTLDEKLTFSATFPATRSLASRSGTLREFRLDGPCDLRPSLRPSYAASSEDLASSATLAPRPESSGTLREFRLDGPSDLRPSLRPSYAASSEDLASSATPSRHGLSSDFSKGCCSRRSAGS